MALDIMITPEEVLGLTSNVQQQFLLMLSAKIETGLSLTNDA